MFHYIHWSSEIPIQPPEILGFYAGFEIQM